MFRIWESFHSEIELSPVKEYQSFSLQIIFNDSNISVGMTMFKLK